MSLTISQRIDALLAKMTLEEKLAQLTSCWMHELQTHDVLDPEKIKRRLQYGIGQISRPGGDSTLSPREVAKAVNQLQRYLLEQTRLGIPAIFHEETCSGVMLNGAMIYPQPINLASTFQPELAEAMSRAIRRQMLALGIRQGLAPVLDLARDPRWGRVEETFGEDPILAALFGIAYVRGLQGESLHTGVMATGKHFVGHSASQGGLNCAPVSLGLRELYETYLAPFQAVIREANIASIMNAYPELDGELMAASRRMLTDLLRGVLGFKGLVVSDYDAIQMIHTYHRVAPDLRRAAVLALRAGIDVELPSTTCYGEALRQALEAGELEMEVVDQAVRHHLQKKFELGLFEQPYVDEERVAEVFSNHEDRLLARHIARQSLVLLKNDGLLPLTRSLRTLAVIGPNAHSGRNLLGDYSYPVQRELAAVGDYSTGSNQALTASMVTVLQGLRTLAAPSTTVLYAQGCDNLNPNTDGFEEAIRIARQSEVVVLVLGDRSGLLPHCTSGETRDSASLRLPGIQSELAQAILKIGKPTAVVLISGRPYAISELAEQANAILEAWIPGEEGGMAIAEALFGEVNPGGKLPITFPRSVGQIPIFYSHKPSALRSNWHGDYVDESTQPLYPFGHGLSYTTFMYENLTITPSQAIQGETVNISLEVWNSGKCSGDEVVQLYVCDECASLPRPVKELKGFVRISLAPKERKTVTFHLPVNQLAFYNPDLHLVLEPGRFQVMVGSSSTDIRLRGEFEIVGTTTMTIAQRVFICPVSIR
ncbi:MAG: glycoside hydrolase family 3 C-terminal domain-containing protein [Chloroflexus sp.]|jgi:beta-glucosidase|nr:glycoside hydrolase family 3 C-terminal domain-containing protein [Chloroflexus sp.]